ncbi:MAG: hypothetical protein AAGA18_11305 [Verrucomicrobiota bacterium]
MIQGDELILFLAKSKDDNSLIALIKKCANDYSFDKDEAGYYCVLSDAGIDLVFDEEGLLDTVFFYSQNHRNEAGNYYNGNLPKELTFELSKEGVMQILGGPSEVKEKQNLFGLEVPASEKYYLSDCSMHIEYNSEQSAMSRLILVKPKVG